MAHADKASFPPAPKLDVPPGFDYIPHELADLLPMMEKSEFEGLKADIAKRGILDPIVLFQGKILDGRNRYKAGKEVGHKFVPDNFKAFTGIYAEAEAFVFSSNLHRRHMTNAQKQEFIKKMIDKYPN